MDPAEAWNAYCESFELANWTPTAAQVCAPAAGLPHPLLEYASIDIDMDMDMDIFGACCSLHRQQAPVPASAALSMGVGGHGQQLAADYNSVEDFRGIVNTVRQEGISVDRPVTNDFRTDESSLMKKKMHRYPASLQGISESYTVPRFVAIGPYHMNQTHLKKAEKVKAAATSCYVEECGEDRLEEMYTAVASLEDDARRLYDEDVMEDITSTKFQCMMFVDACFLVQYMRMQSNIQDDAVIDESLKASMRPIRTDILHDVMLLENQLPWKVVQKVKAFLPATTTPTSFLPDFISSLRGCLQDRKIDPKDKVPIDWAEGYEPPHLLGLLRYYIVGKEPSWAPADPSHGHRTEGSSSRRLKASSNMRSVSHSAIELAKLGIRLIPTKEKTTELIHMGLNMEAGLFHAEFTLPPLSLNRDRASYLVNMAAHELCTVQSFGAAPYEESAVCSYLLLLAMLAYREEDVHQLRVRGLLQGGGGLSNEDALRFFTSLQGLRLGKRYLHVMEQIERYRDKRPKRTRCNECCYDNKKTITAVLGGIVSLATIIGTLVSIKTAL